MATSIEILTTLQPPLRWVPEKKEITEDFLRSKSNDPNGPKYEDLTDGMNSVLQEAQRILGRCLPPTEPAGRETGLVVGYVQSGKTMSFETVISLARDNGYGLVIVLAGTKNNLRDQSENRLKKDLGIDDGENWYHYSNPTSNVKRQIEDKLVAWKKKPTKKSILITVLKHGGHLENLANLVEKLSVSGVPSLIIDDESDQASLNTQSAKIRSGKVAPSEMSTTYEKICKLRDELPHHSYLQYTATPQANLLLAQTDLLNASFAELVTPGEAYTGGKSFFGKDTPLVRNIPSEEVPGPTNILKGSPKSLLSALRYFLLACAHHALTRERKKDRNRSMMIHPAMATTSHTHYMEWLDRSLKTLKSLVEKQYIDKVDVVAHRFQAEYDSLKNTYPKIKPLTDLLSAMVDEVFSEMNHVMVNGTKDAEKNIDWKATPYWILVGGAKLDRGYTVEGLCVTYMPRPLGTSPAADTLQQRARFFGYKKAYLGLCRVFIQKNVSEAFTEYVEHEEFVREALENSRGKPLSDWRRDFVLTSMLKATRANVVGLGTRRIPANGWMVPDVLQRDDNAALANQELLSSVVRKWTTEYGDPVNVAEFSQFKGSKDSSPHFMFDPIPLKAVLEDFLLEVKVKDPSDAEEHSAMLLAIAALLRKSPNLKADVFLMNNLVAGYRTRSSGRGVEAKHRFAPINQYFSQSADTVNDRSFRSNERVSIQLRRFNLGTTLRDSGSADIKNVTWFALHVPSKLRTDLLIEARR
ncbi:Z1 domain [Serratia marcescens]|uniref:Z1 domain-containing protein n=1 Tax=Serratia marcescens TaxID=615 RepID=UPI0021797D51|nr:Z1 domain-containing protein [Serratia marcescens]CAI1822306.1 Z1 domain [Serratia marcescens]